MEYMLATVIESIFSKKLLNLQYKYTENFLTIFWFSKLIFELNIIMYAFARLT